VRIFLLFMVDVSHTEQMARSDLSQMARNFLEGLRARAVMLSDPSMP